ncbi:NAD(P)/FAD-dependent oxidoreductase [Nonomuraea africana]|uniref:NAD(P)/FAD-dependent oxidoreductase n=1 Tax=Nonomuraea africana TaxID=46171 RepID=UPI0033C2A3B0
MRITVIGSGIVGAAAAYHLGLRGVGVTVVDGGQAGAATAAGAGIVCPWVDHEDDDDWYRLTVEGARHYAELPASVGHARVGALVVAEDPAELEPVRALLATRYADAPEMGEITEVARPAELFPPLDPKLSALHVPGAARVDGRAVRDGLLQAAVRQGATVHGGAAALTADGAVTTAEGTRLEADAVIVAAGAWTGQACRPLGVDLPVFPRRGQIVHATVEGADTSAWPIVLPRRGPYLLGFPGGRVVVGATVEEVGFDPRITVAGLGEVLTAGLAVAPGLAAATVTETRVGLRPVMSTGRPLIARVADRVVAVTGLSAYGLTAGPYAGLLAAALALGEEPAMDLAPFAV